METDRTFLTAFKSLQLPCECIRETITLQRGKFRPRLTEMVKQNSREEVELVTRKGLASLPDLSRAMTQLTKLKAVGPATASGM